MDEILGRSTCVREVPEGPRAGDGDIRAERQVQGEIDRRQAVGAHHNRPPDGCEVDERGGELVTARREVEAIPSALVGRRGRRLRAVTRCDDDAGQHAARFIAYRAADRHRLGRNRDRGREPQSTRQDTPSDRVDHDSNYERPEGTD